MKQKNTDLKVAVFLANGCEDIEAMTPIDLMDRAGIPHTTVSITDNVLVTTSHGVTLTADCCINYLNFDDFDMLVLPGGIPGTPNLEACKTLTDHVLSFAKVGKQIAAICAAPSIFAKLGLLNGVEACCNPSFENVLVEYGALLTQTPVTVSGNIITSRAMGTAIPFGLAIVEHYLGKEAADQLSRDILYS